MKYINPLSRLRQSHNPEGSKLMDNKHVIVGLIYLVIICISFFSSFVMYFYDTKSCISLIVLGIVSLTGWMVNKAGKTNISAGILIASLFITIQFNIISGFGIHDVAIIAWPAFIFFSGLLFGWQVIPAVTAIIMVLAVLTNLVPNPQFLSYYSNTGDLIVMLLILLANSLIAVLLLRSNEQLLRNSQQSDERTKAIFHSINDAIIICDSLTGVILDFNEKYSEMFAGNPDQAATQDKSIFHPGNESIQAENIFELIRQAAPKGEQHMESLVLDKNKCPIWVEININLASIAKLTHLLITVRDITERKQAEAKILAALEEKETLLREVHHRVKNNLQAMIALIDLQSLQTSDLNTKQFLLELEGQARTMALVYEQLYQSINLARVQMSSYLQQLTRNITETFGSQRHFQLELNVRTIELDVVQAMPCGLIINELFTNILKHAFPAEYSGKPMVTISMIFDGDNYQLTVSDNGVGLKPGLEWQRSPSLGLRLVNLWATHQLGGTLSVSSVEGMTFSITFPKVEGEEV